MSNEKQTIIWQLIAQMAFLMLLYAGTNLLASLKFLANVPLVTALPYIQISGFSHVLFDFALLSGLIAAALFYTAHHVSNALRWAYRGWTLLVVLSVLAGILGLLEGRHMLELPFFLDILLIILLTLWMIVIWQDSQQSETEIIFLIGMAIIILAFALSLFPVSNPVQDRLLRVVTVNLRFFVGYSLSGLALISWLKRSETAPFFSSAILVLVGTLVSLTPLNAIGILNFPTMILFPIILFGMLMIAQDSIAQGHRWVNLGLFFLLMGMGLVGSLLAITSIGQFTLGTHLNDLPFSLIAWVIIAIVLGSVSHWLEDTHDYRSVNTTSISFKWIAAGLLISHLTLLIIGIAQVYMERILNLGYLNTQNTLIPLYILWISANLIWTIGIALYVNAYLNSANHLAKVNTT